MLRAIATAQGLQSRLAPPDATSEGRLWSGMTVNWHDWQEGGEARSPELDHDVLAMRTSGNVRLTQIRDGKTHVANISSGNISIHPRGMESRWMWDRPGAILVLRMPPQLLADAAAAVSKSEPGRVELQNVFSLRDQFIEQLGLLLLNELRNPEHPSQAYITQALSNALACHLVHRLNSQALRPDRLHARMHPRTLQRVQDYIAANLHEQIDLQTLAGIANVSKFHFARMFREAAGMTAMAYLEHARMQRAQQLIRSSGLPMGQIGSLVGYEDQSYFSKRFRRYSGLTPSSYVRAIGAKRCG